MDILTSEQASELWGITARRVRELCRGGYVEGAVKVGNAWLMPKNTKKPDDRRITTGRYIGVKRNKSKEAHRDE